MSWQLAVGSGQWQWAVAVGSGSEQWAWRWQPQGAVAATGPGVWHVSPNIAGALWVGGPVSFGATPPSWAASMDNRARAASETRRT